MEDELEIMKIPLARQGRPYAGSFQNMNWENVVSFWVAQGRIIDPAATGPPKEKGPALLLQKVWQPLLCPQLGFPCLSQSVESEQCSPVPWMQLLLKYKISPFSAPF